MYPGMLRRSLCDPIPNLNANEKASVAGWLNDYYMKTITPLPPLSYKRKSGSTNS